jgi:hypothetical protein
MNSDYDKGDQEGKNNSQDLSIINLFDVFKKTYLYIRYKWSTVVIAALLGGLLGLGYAVMQKVTYTASCTFVLEDGSKGGGLSQYAGLAGLAGINIGGGGSGGIFSSDNIIELYKSRIMLEKALLTSVNINGKKQLLIDRYINFNHLNDKWKQKGELANINFNGNPENFNRKQDSIITDLIDLFNKKMLDVDKIDKKLSIIGVNVTSNDELFAKAFTNVLVGAVNNFYLKTKTKKNDQNVQILQHQTDSIKNVLNSSINGVASANDATPNANPLLSTLRVPSQRRQIDVQASTAIYAEIVKNLELAKISLRQETPLIQLIDQPTLPLFKNKTSKPKAFIIGMLLSLFITIGVLITKKVLGKLRIKSYEIIYA